MGAVTFDYLHVVLASVHSNLYLVTEQTKFQTRILVTKREFNDVRFELTDMMTPSYSECERK